MNSTKHDLSPWAPLALFALALMLVYLFLPTHPAERVYDIPYSQFKQLVSQRQVAEVTLRGEAVTGTLLDPIPLGPQGQEGKRFTTRVPAFGDDSLLPGLETSQVKVQVERGDEGAGAALLGLLPWLIFLGVYLWLLRRVYRNLSGGLGGGLEFKKGYPLKAGQLVVSMD